MTSMRICWVNEWGRGKEGKGGGIMGRRAFSLTHKFLLGCEFVITNGGCQLIKRGKWRQEIVA